MESNLSRRRTLHGVGSALGMTALSGCLFGGNSLEAGDLVIDNNHDKPHTLTVTVTKTSTDSDGAEDHEETPSPDTTPIWKRKRQFTIGSQKRKTESEFVAETGAFYLEVTFENGTEESGWVGFYPAHGGGVAEDVIHIDIFDDGRVNVSASHGD